MHVEDKFAHNWLIKKVVNDRVKKDLSLLRGRVYDLGCGVRPYEQDIMKQAREYFGVDWSNCIHGQNCDVVPDLNNKLPIDSDVADTVVSFEVLEHLSEPQTMLNESNRILKRQGNVLLSVPFQWWVHEAPWDYYRYTRHGLDYMLKKAGFIDIYVEETTGFWEMGFLKLNYQTLPLIRGFVRGILIPFWWINQQINPLLSKHWKAENETAGYVVVAKKP
ncbi:conserved hypothetical protein [Candidatus Methylobacter favarea]|uniref:Class I SAM-dependent methyltransferase n=1 Tax=Candidatus Methylobacter favarea TaxID=2707345 RepID=A0A8S0XQW0_9GAMM|nr:methyltransferase domain-containing protein [Candidatus Methylobacter favarea]CAA9889567.1 conserved hypothetical protein [Candidatus Methylobacter favarea]